jgi:hypothetical protein
VRVGLKDEMGVMSAGKGGGKTLELLHAQAGTMEVMNDTQGRYKGGEGTICKGRT